MSSEKISPNPHVFIHLTPSLVVQILVLNGCVGDQSWQLCASWAWWHCGCEWVWIMSMTLMTRCHRGAWAKRHRPLHYFPMPLGSGITALHTQQSNTSDRDLGYTCVTWGNPSKFGAQSGDSNVSYILVSEVLLEKNVMVIMAQCNVYTLCANLCNP